MSEQDQKSTEELFTKYSKGFFEAVQTDMNQYQFAPGFTFERDCLSFLYGRYIVLSQSLKQSSGKDFTVADASYHLGSAFAGFLGELKTTTDLVDDNFMKKAQEVFEVNVLKGFNERIKTVSDKPLSSEE